ncbi:HEAT repeat domain-containing protein [Methanothrix sp.]|uniref:HEAT repeat domain-containing protein n=1 Tax=Methanothrix sp. TaxID=90426 RepID=UPI002B70AA51|nr:HEAT repeat domain-containing protein [Methanothrix sp.]HOK57997.1 HEAT repeat domain-containing protein [Methanothrix sp.]HOL43400.1 HEAT repeat domain-containing protein [Methanothrix sp.]HPO88403.1 HEAT repeat domain-containing protein [Methanothrix sp.]
MEMNPDKNQGDEPEIPEVLPDESWPTDRLIEATRDRNMLVRSNAVSVLAGREGQEVVEALIQAMRDEDYVVRSNAMVKLSERGTAILDRILQALDDPDENIRAGAAWVLGELKDPRAIEPLQNAMNDENVIVRIQARASLMAMGVIGQKK